ncbi:MAG: M60 family metallopeptidase [Bacteroidetes bacterium]|nr:M60 family metallopeptidase [Bacteroidota bacterium]
MRRIIFVLPLLVGSVLAQSGDDAILRGIHRLKFDLQMSTVNSSNPALKPILWLETRGPMLSSPVLGWFGPHGNGRVAIWAGHEGAMTSQFDGMADNDAFRYQLIAWLLNGGKTIACTQAHSEWLQLDGISKAVRQRLRSDRVTVNALSSWVTEETLKGIDLLIVGNPWGDFSEEEIDAVEQWVDGGGSLFVVGLGWSWGQAPEDYPVNTIGKRFGWKVEQNVVTMPAEGMEVPRLSSFEEHKAVTLKVGVDDVRMVKELARQNPDKEYIIVGEHMGLALASDEWKLLKDPEGTVLLLDALWATEMKLVSGVNPPAGGKPIIYAPETFGKNNFIDPTPWWMHSGNPIVFRVEASKQEIIPNLNKQRTGWGMPHEQGHNMVGDACGDLFTVNGTAEEWANVYTVWTYKNFGWDYAQDQSIDIYEEGHAHHLKKNPTLAEVQNSSWVLLGCLELIWSKYGWDGMQKFMTASAKKAATGVRHDSDEEKTAWFAEQLSQAYQLDLSPLLAHWGFRVSAASRKETSVYAKPDIRW